MQGPRLASHFNGSVQLSAALEAQEKQKSPTSPDPTSPLSDDERDPPIPSDVKAESSNIAPDPAGEQEATQPPQRGRWTGWMRNLKRHGAFVGPGVIASVAYIDPGNWATDLQAGSQFGYSHLFVVLLAGFIALLYQILSARLGIVTGVDLATHCRNNLFDRPRHKLLYRWGMLYPLYFLSECGIILTDLAELLGSAIAINLLIPQIPLPACIVLTAADVLFILMLFQQYPAKMLTRSMRMFELVIGVLVLVVLASFIALLVKVEPNWGDAFFGYIPGPGMIDNGGLFIAVGILGATVMPHAFFIGSKLATVHRITPEQYDPNYRSESTALNLPPAKSSFFSTESGPHLHLPQPVALGAFRLRRAAPKPETQEVGVEEIETLAVGRGLSTRSTSAEGEDKKQPSSAKSSSVTSEYVAPRTLACVRAHLGHAQFDIAGSLLGFAVVINSAILIVAAAVFYYGTAIPTTSNVTDLFDAFDLVKLYIGTGFAYIFAVGLLASGQAASLTVTLAGQIVSEGFIDWQTTPWKRRAITRAIGIVPSLAVAIAVGRNGIDLVLIASQVGLSFVLPFVIAPLLIFTTNEILMSVPIDFDAELPKEVDPLASPHDIESSTSVPAATPVPSSPTTLYNRTVSGLKKVNPFRRRTSPAGRVTFANPIIVVWLGWTFWVLINLANILAVYQIAVGAA